MGEMNLVPLAIIAAQMLVFILFFIFSRSLQKGLDKTKADYAAAQNELQNIKKKKPRPPEEVAKRPEPYPAVNAEVTQLKRERAQLKSTLASRQEELKKALSQGAELESDLKKKSEELKVLEKVNQQMESKIRDLGAHLDGLTKDRLMQNKIITEHKKQYLEGPKASEQEIIKSEKELEVTREKGREKIGELLLTHNFISKDILNKALEYQEKFGTSITQYLLAYGFIDESQLAQCICSQFGTPYLPLSYYEIPKEIIQLVPVDIAEKYWLIPVEKIGNLLMVVMADPLDHDAIKKVTEITGCRVQPFVGILSEILAALEDYYGVVLKEKDQKAKRTIPFFIETHTYKGPERRNAVRFKAKIKIYFPIEGQYKESVTKDVSRTGFLFESESNLAVGSVITVQLELPQDYTPLPIAAIVQVVRVALIEEKKFEVGVKIVKISQQEINNILEYAYLQKE